MRCLFLISLLFFVSGCDAPAKSPPALHCGGIGAFVCPNQMYCDFGINCGGIDQDGVCKPRPIDCPNVTEEVCGCDGKTYGNRCYANTIGITVAYDGPCGMAANR